MDTCDAILHMNEGKTVTSPAGFLYHKYGNQYEFKASNDDRWMKAISIPLATDGWKTYEGKPKYVRYEKAFDAAVAGKTIQFENISVWIDSDGDLNTTDDTCFYVKKEMLTEKKWIIKEV